MKRKSWGREPGDSAERILLVTQALTNAFLPPAPDDFETLGKKISFPEAGTVANQPFLVLS